VFGTTAARGAWWFATTASIVESAGEATARARDGFETWWGETSGGTTAVGTEGGGTFTAAEHCCLKFIVG